MSTKADLGPSAFAQATADRRTATLDTFQRRHIGPDAAAQDEMLRSVGVPSVDAPSMLTMLDSASNGAEVLSRQFVV